MSIALPAGLKAGPLFLLSNGGVLSYRCFTRLYRDKGDQHNWDRYEFSPDLEKALKLAEQTPVPEHMKKRLALLGLWNSESDQDAIAADFDKLPPGFADHGKFREYLRKRFHGQASVFETPSGKTKAIVVVNKPLGMVMNTETALATLKNILGDELFAWIDKTPTSLRQCFLTPDAVERLSNELHTLIPFEARIEHDELFTGELDSEYWIHGLTPAQSQKALRFEQYAGSLDQWPKLKEYAEFEKSRDSLVRLLLCIHPLLDGYDLPQRYFATLIGSSQPTLSRALAELEGLQLLSCTHKHRMFPQRRAKRFIAQGELLDAIKHIANPFGSPLVPLEELVAQIRDENFYTPAFDIGRMHFKNDPEAYERFMLPFTGDNPERKRRVENNATQLREWASEFARDPVIERSDRDGPDGVN